MLLLKMEEIHLSFAIHFQSSLRTGPISISFSIAPSTREHLLQTRLILKIITYTSDLSPLSFY